MKPVRSIWMAKGFVILIWLIVPSLSIAASHLVVLQYHHFGKSTPPSTSIPLEQFEKHIAYLVKNHYVILSLETGLKRLQQGLPVPENGVALTMDDAYISVYTQAYPRLKKLNWPFTVFVATRDIDRGGALFMTWDQMREMASNGVEFAAHSHTHPYMIRKRHGEIPEQWQKRVTGEIQTSKNRLQEELGKNSVLFAYPYGEYNLELKEIVRQLGMIGVAQQSGSSWSGSDFGAVPRFPMSGSYADMKGFKVKINSLPLPVVSTQPDDPVLLPASTKPTLRLKMDPADYDLDSFTCFATGQGKIGLNWIDRKNLEFEVVPHKPLPTGRSRFNCTAAQRNSTRYYWYSHQWIRVVK